MRLEAVELRTVRLPLVHPFRTSFGTEHDKEALLLRVMTDVGVGWGECVSSPRPLYSSEYNAAAADVLSAFLLPRLFAEQWLLAENVAALLQAVRGHRMAKAAIEMAVLDAELRHRGQSLGAYLGAVVDRVPSGVSVGIAGSIPELLDHVGRYLAEGYVRIKLKIEPGWDIEPVEAVRREYGDIALQVDANAAYRLEDTDHLSQLDEFELLLIEQPLGEEELLQHAELARSIRTPVCLDESIVSAQSAADAIALGACSIINIKAGRVGGYLEAVRVAQVAASQGVAVWCGGMVETGLGRAANAALAALPGFTLTGDISGSDRFFETDITPAVVMRNGFVEVPTGAGLGLEPIEEMLDRFTVDVRTVTAAQDVSR